MVVMLCTRSRGGMRAVVEAYRAAGLFDRHDVVLIDTHDEGSISHRLIVASAALWRFFCLLTQRRVTLVHAHISMRGSFWRKSIFIALAQRFGVPVLGHLHGSSFEQFVAELGPARRRKLVKRLESLDRLLVLGHGWRQFVLSLAPAAHVDVLPNAVTLPPLERLHRPPAPNVTLLFLGIVGQRKGVFDLLPAFARAAAVRPQLRLVIAGNGEVERAQAEAHALGIDGVTQFVGWVGGEAKQRLLQTSDVYVLPSHNEGLPVSILEAMSWQLPILSTSIGAIPEAVRDGVDGIIVTAGDVDALCTAILRLCDSYELRRQMGQQARQRVENEFSEERVLPRLERLYHALQAGSAVETFEER